MTALNWTLSSMAYDGTPSLLAGRVKSRDGHVFKVSSNACSAVALLGVP